MVKQQQNSIKRISDAELQEIKNSPVGVNPEFIKKKSLGSIAYNSAKKGMGIAFPAALFLTKGSLPVSIPIGVGFSWSCMLGDLGEQYGGSVGKIIGRTVGNANKYILTASVELKPVDNLKMSAAAINGGLSGGDLSFAPSAVITIGIEIVESVIKARTLKGVTEGVVAGITLDALILIYPATSKGLDFIYDVVVNAPDYTAALVNPMVTPLLDYIDGKTVTTGGQLVEHYDL